ncbi:hypothetical protein [Acetobacter pasteurianus]|uniref:Uncharacterized protein n=1 Tax=Acetobacter pasteurianus (strain NBRC 105184 / IFO 3283-01) TaxID=634452 RepID=C7JDD1_ACEP3|nr:hypothetical protein [Acetobacter pasteurianus]BAI00143.1 hypothetical protein APA01_20210 [Acetobacter pasteurianus IFO 3283-01]BAI03196.1 hypothetical protein APA03_20210 [Acetobacter pasteurianus IFO 3283-03]BAI06241.1 hypothetical protein APA07_20210 [Acetobacter pasteurianus IFO 3283-07]BAI09291.1 hypothetical protein APA22_20210 [Acetobacter pasteurianus IFO 3283-22]BAI12339.1 hypothetical protein APA26_20210 [Acetobacter pasteurianus IFO 3283-26]
MKHRQDICRGAVVRHLGKRSLIIAVLSEGVITVPLHSPSIPRHRADVIMPPLAGIGIATARCADLSYEIFSRLNPLNETSSECFGEKEMACVDAAIRKEIVDQAGEQLPAGIIKSTFRPVFGSRGRKVGGAPSD